MAIMGHCHLEWWLLPSFREHRDPFCTPVSATILACIAFKDPGTAPVWRKSIGSGMSMPWIATTGDFRFLDGPPIVADPGGVVAAM